MARSRMAVAFEEVESPQARMLRHMIDGDLRDEDLTNAGGPRRRGIYWCAADRPQTDDGFRVAPVYRTSEVPNEAVCEECGIGIRELQDMMS